MQQTTYALFLSFNRVVDRISRLQHPRVNSNECQCTDVRVGCDLEGQGGDTLAGIFTDSDLRRLLAKNSQNLNHIAELTLAHVVSAHPMTVQAQALASETLKIFEDRHISRIVCLEGEKPVGLLSLFDLLDHKIA